MAGLKSVIRLRKHELDEKRRAIAQLNTMLENLRREEQRELANLEAEKKAAAGDWQALAVFPHFQKRVQTRLALLRKEQEDVERGIARAQEKLQEAFKELKTYEITEDNRAKDKAAKEKREETARLDDIGVEGFRRKSSKMDG